jgi:hypothetical protein
MKAPYFPLVFAACLLSSEGVLAEDAEVLIAAQQQATEMAKAQAVRRGAMRDCFKDMRSKALVGTARNRYMQKCMDSKKALATEE